jgi:hypothetical protein
MVTGSFTREILGGSMSRILIVSYRPLQGQFQEVVALLREQYRRIRALGVALAQPPLLARSAAGELTFIAAFAQGEDVDRCWEDPDFQDLDARLSEVAEMIPVRSLHEASGSYMDLEEVAAEPRLGQSEKAGAILELLS